MPTRRHFLQSSAAALAALATNVRGDGASPKVPLHRWQRAPANPIFVPRETYDSAGCQAPFVVRPNDEYFLFYGGIDKAGRQRVCLATAPVADAASVGTWTRRGPVFDLGGKGAFDELSATYPCVHRIGRQWHLYYTGRSTQQSRQHFANYRGLGLAVSDNLSDWKKFSADPVLTGEGYPGFPDNKVLVGLGNIVELPQADGRILYRMYHTLPPGLEDQEWHVIEDKHAVVAHSYDGLRWTDKKIVLSRRRDVAYEDIGIVGLNVWRTPTGEWHGVYTGLGTKGKSYALCEATSPDGLTWHRGTAGKNLSLEPLSTGWEKTMIGYPSLDVTTEQVTLFYNGTGGGSTGIGLATAVRKV